MKTLIINEKNDGKKLTTYLTTEFPRLNINEVYKALRKKDIKINGKRTSENLTLHYGDKVEVYIIDSILDGTSNVNINTVYEDDNIVIFNKPANLEVEGTNSLTSIMSKNYDFLEPCHRIDRNTQGLVLFAKNKESLDILESMFKNNEIDKHYIALCYGVPKAKSKDLYGYLFKDSKKSIVFISDEPRKNYVRIKTSYSVIKSDTIKKISLLDVTLHTGRTHQIRAQLAHSSLPIVGDGKYGSYEINKRFKASYQLLESHSIGFNSNRDLGILNYLNGKVISIKKTPFIKYFD